MRTLIIVLAMLPAVNAYAEPVERPAAPSVQVRPTFEMQSLTIDKTALIEQARTEYVSEQYAESFTTFQTLLMHDRYNIEASIGLGNAALSLGYFEEAYTTFARLKDLRTTFDTMAEIEAGYALAKVESGRSRNIVRDLKSAIAVSGQDYRLWNALGRYYDKSELWGDSFNAYFTALSMGQGRAITLNNLGMSQMMQGNYKAAHESFANASALKPETALYDNNRRLALALQRDYPNAVKDIDADRAAYIYNDAGYLAMTSGDKHLARLLFEKAITISPVHHAKAHANLGILNSL